MTERMKLDAIAAFRAARLVLDVGGSKQLLMGAVRHERYLVNAQAVGVSRDAAEAELRKVREEGVDGDDHEVALYRLVTR